MTRRSRGHAAIARLVTVPTAVVAAFLMAGTALAAPTWTWQQPPIAAGASNGILGGVSCPSAGACVAVGTTAVAIPPIADSSLLFGVSCHTWDTCVGVGYDIQRTGAHSLAEHES
jgi:hypothetical protein